MAWAPKGRKAAIKSEYRKPEWSKLYRQGTQWEKVSKAYRTENPLCVECLKNNVVKAAECVDHIKPHKGDLELFWGVSNWQSLCGSCHSAKTRRGE